MTCDKYCVMQHPCQEESLSFFDFCCYMAKLGDTCLIFGGNRSIRRTWAGKRKQQAFAAVSGGGDVIVRDITRPIVDSHNAAISFISGNSRAEDGAP
jgi:hypothetical protein